ncbi:uncharacterized protein YnzC (UPF0291/DUF896 family) [Geomicrobium halophilum]|uniref:UPF0291 protein HNR44_001157 n=1 Tax=Geomicrobium halophilum TaxID=549000 RepID=A0A841Q0V0_9BACL|nr:DUF896 domain-containing protein [Geomicrobium halophilum]MBB6449208.1 uncharacterized protein YnzC (UPF0291/DUF896 family) [Geomicrobium halophilum]
MISDEKLDRINELAKREKTTGLTPDEEDEQKNLRQEYLNNFRASFNQQIQTVTVMDEEGKEVTPKKLRDAKKKRRSH